MVISEAQATYELWEEGPPVIPPHSRLYHLKPIGVGGPMVESLTSYISRLAEAHSIYPRTLITDEILPRLSLSHLYRGGYPVYGHLTRFWKQSSTLNGTNTTAGSWVRLLEHMTIRHDLRFLTMLTWTSVLSSRGLLRPTQAWCPICYQEWRKGERTIYQPLLWQLSVITTCPRHHVPLHLHCPFMDCEQAFSPLTPHTQIGYCPQCERWLGNTLIGSADKKPLSEEHERQYWIFTVVGELLAAAPYFPLLPRQEVIATAISAHVNGMMGGNYSAFARCLSVHRRTAWEWGQGTQIPRLDTLLQLCTYLGISLVQLFKGYASGSYPIHTQEPEKKPPTQKAQKRFRKFDTDRLRCALESALQEESIPPPSMREVAESLQYDSSHLYKHFPDLCRAIAARFRTYQKKQRHLRLQIVEKEVQQAADTLSEQGRFPSERQIGKMLKSRGVLKENAVRIVLHNAQRKAEEKS